jgi:hypothetical protein
MLASSEIDFDFDDVVVDSAVYRRVLAAAKRQGDTGKRPEINTDLVGNIGSGPMGKESITVATRVRSKQPSWQPANDQTYRGRQPQKTTNPRHATRKSDHGSAAKACARCDLNFAKSEQFVKALGASYHYDCFTCKVCYVSSRSWHVYADFPGRTAVLPLLKSFFQLTTKRNSTIIHLATFSLTLCARLTTSDDWT